MHRENTGRRRVRRRRTGLVLVVLLGWMAGVPGASLGTTSSGTGGGAAAFQEIPLAPGVTFSGTAWEEAGIRRAAQVLTVDRRDGASVALGVTDPLHVRTNTLLQARRVQDGGFWVAGAINGTFHELDGSGMPATMLIRDGHLLHLGRLSPDPGGYNHYRFAFGVDRDGVPRIAPYELEVRVTFPAGTFPVTRMNHNRATGELSLFTPSHRFPTVGENPSGYATEIVIGDLSEPLGSLPVGQAVQGTVLGIVRMGEPANTLIPRDGIVLSGNGRSWEQALAPVSEGDRVELEVALDASWEGAAYLVQSGPLLVREGQVDLSMDPRAPAAAERRPRSAVAVDAAGERVFLVTVDGSRPGYSRGMTLPEFAAYLVGLGADRAINLDGGGSTTCAIRLPGAEDLLLANWPADGAPRSVSSSLLALSEPPVPADPGPVLLLDPLEDPAGWEATAVRGQAGLSGSRPPGPVRMGEGALRLSYDFSGSPAGVSAAYLAPLRPRILPGEPLEIGAWVFGDGGETWLRATLLDRHRSPVTLDFTGDGKLDWLGWRYVRARIPGGTAYPVSFQRIYVAQTREERKGAGAVLVDHLEAIYDPAYQVPPFSDMDEGHWALADVLFLFGRGIVTGYGDGSLQPGREITREQAALMLSRALEMDPGDPPGPGFKDVDPGRYSYGAIAAVAGAGLMQGSRPHHFDPLLPLTRAELAVILDRAYRFPGGGDPPAFSDLPGGHWAFGAVGNLAGAGIAGGYPDGTFRPAGPVTRAEFSAFMARAMRRQ